ncbi:hypothetical protein GYMLUDRAFT_214349 [Collybiopsis luxurians FD-317 M1]|nr:hypothetical protein GYMLUDRAFT_214349 [Collybiopsis luxurians FD-317 M1]
MTLPELDTFLNWFQSNGGTINLNAIGFKHFPPSEGGRGAVALKNFEKGAHLFTIPRSLTLSAKTSSLPGKFGLKSWKECKLDKGWSGLILCMMWEAAQGSESKWAPYLATLPISFDTPMFWDDSDLKELEGTSVVEKLGKTDAEEDYNNKVVPAIQTRPDLFPPESIPFHYSLEQYHLMGSRILSRSFDVERPPSADADADANDENPEEAVLAGTEEADQSMESTSAMDVDEDVQVQVPMTGVDGNHSNEPSPQAEADNPHSENEGEGEDEEEDEENPIDVSMVPIADLLNARFGSENAKLFYDETELKMMTTKKIKAGEQIWNTYGDLPNSELLRRYGHVDILPLPGGGGGKLKGNPGDVVEIRADLVVSVFAQLGSGSESMDVEVHTSPDTNPSSASAERIDWWLEEGGDDVFALDMDYEIPESMISLTRLLHLSTDEWEKAREKGKPPKPKLDTQALDVLVTVLRKRLGQYPTSVEEDEDVLTRYQKEKVLVSLNKYQATVVRLGEKRILRATLDRLLILRAPEEKGGAGKSKNLKRKTASGSGSVAEGSGSGSSKGVKKSKR